MGFAVIAHALIYVVVTSRLGRAMRAITNELPAQSQGINPLSYRLLALSLSALLAGIVGGLFVFYLTIIDPSRSSTSTTSRRCADLRRDRRPRKLLGCWRAARVLAVLPDMLRFTTDLRMVLYGVALIVAWMLIFPGAASAVGSIAARSRAGAGPGRRRARAVTCAVAGPRPHQEVPWPHRRRRRLLRGRGWHDRLSIGPNGSGKSTSIDCISGFQPANGGQWSLAASIINGLAVATNLRARAWTRSFQTVRAYDELTLLETYASPRRRPMAWAGCRRCWRQAAARRRGRRRKPSPTTCWPPSALPTTPPPRPRSFLVLWPAQAARHRRQHDVTAASRRAGRACGWRQPDHGAARSRT